VSTQLGVDTVAGALSYLRQHRFLVRDGPVGLRAFRDFLPDGPAWPRFVALVRYAAGLEQDWDAQIVLRREEVPKAHLDGTARLGWTSWLHSETRAEDADDLVLQGR
jgi:type VI secretion system protein ImpH